MSEEQIKKLQERKAALREKQRNLSLEEKVQILEDLHEHSIFIKENPIKRIK